MPSFFFLSSLQININEKRVYSYLHENIIQIFFLHIQCDFKFYTVQYSVYPTVFVHLITGFACHMHCDTLWSCHFQLPVGSLVNA